MMEIRTVGTVLGMALFTTNLPNSCVMVGSGQLSFRHQPLLVGVDIADLAFRDPHAEPLPFFNFFVSE